MNYNIEIEENKHINKFLKHNKKYEELIRDNIKNVLPMLIEEKPYKIKTAHGLKYKGKLIYEYKIKLDKYVDCRVAYIIDGLEITIFFISNTIIKKQFVSLLEKIENIS